MMTFYYREGRQIKHITLNCEEYEQMIKTTKLYSTEKEARKNG